MAKQIKTLIFALLLFLIPFVNAVQVVEAPAPAEEKKGVFSGLTAFLHNPIFWYVLIGFVVVTLICVGLFFLVKFLVKFIKKQNDIFYLLKQQRISMAKVHRRYDSTHWFKVAKNTPIRLARTDEHGKVYISRPIANHRGDYQTHEGNMIISLNLEGRKKYFIFPDTDVLVIPNKEKVIIQQRNERGEKVGEIVYDLPIAKDIVQFNEGEILIYAESLSRVGEFLIPVLKTKDGKIVDLSLPVYNTLKEVVLGDYLYEQTSAFGILAKRSMDINPNIRAITKVGDANQQVEVPSQNPQ